MWRGMENIVKGADPRDAWMIMQRICGVCTTVHAIISVRAVEDAIGAKVPVNAQYIRNMILAAPQHSRPYRALLSTLRRWTGWISPLRYKLILKSSRYAKRCLYMVIKQC